MSKILEQLRQAEAQRQRIVAERKHFEDEANAALAAREKEELAARARRGETAPIDPIAQAEEGAPQPARKDRRALAGVALAIVAALIAASWPTVFPPEKEPARTPAPAAVAEPAAAAPSSAGSLLLRLDQDVDAFAARVRGKER